MSKSKSHIKNLQEYINNDLMYQDFCKGKEPSHNDGNTEFEWFCINHCVDIAWVLNKLKECRTSEFEFWKENQKLKLSQITFINDLDTIVMLLKQRPTKKNIKNIINLLKSTREKLMSDYSE